jgi:type I restriction enzyme S subunit
VPVERIRLGEVLQVQRVPVALTGDRLYQRLGIYSWGRGTLHRPAVPAADMGSLRYFEVPADALIVSNIQAWEGALAVTSDDDARCVASNRFFSYLPREAGVLPAYVLEYLLSDEGFEKVQRASPGTQVRNRTLNITSFEDIRVPLPTAQAQAALVARLRNVRQVVERPDTVSNGVDQLLRQQIESADDLQPLGELLEEHYDVVQVEEGKTYERAGVLNKGQGLFGQEPFRGGHTSYSTCFRLAANTVVLSRLGAFEGGVAVVDREFSGFVVSKEFPTLRPRPGVDVDYLRALTSWPGLWEQMAASSPGTPARRGRMSVPLFLKTLVPRHDAQGQQLIGRLAVLRLDIRRRVAHRRRLAAALLPSVRNHVFAELS